MNVVGIIAEYNPFHNGHSYHLKASLEQTGADCSVCVMSGNFMQRGEPALMNKWIRAQMAVENGVDLVVELPFAFSCNQAEYFAMGAVDILNRLGCITYLSFGSESGNLDTLTDVAAFLTDETQGFSVCMKENMKKGFSYPKARYEAVKTCRGIQAADLLKSANNILAVEYLKQLKKSESDIVPVTVKRHGTGYHDLHFNENIGSAAAIREQLLKTKDLEDVHPFLSSKTYEIIKSINPCVNLEINDFFGLLAYRMMTARSEELGAVLSATEGIENKVKKAIINARDVSGLIKAVKSKRYTETRIRRLFSHILIDLKKEDFRQILEMRVNYARVLAFSRTGAELLRQIKKKEWNEIPVLTNINRELEEGAKEWHLLHYDILAADLYNLTADGEVYQNSDYVRKPYIGR